MYGIVTNIYPINDPNVGKYTIHGSYGYIIHQTCILMDKAATDKAGANGAASAAIRQRGQL